MSYKIKFKDSVFKDLKRIGKPNAVNIFDRIEKDLPSEALSNPALKGKFSGLRKFRIGDYRVIYAVISDEEILILRIGHRKEVYEH